MIEDRRYMADTIRSRSSSSTQCQIVKLGSFKFGSQVSYRFNEGPAVHRKIVNVVLTKKQIWIPAWLEPWISPPPAAIQLIMVAVNDVWPAITTECEHHLIERVFRQGIAGWKKGHKFTCRQA